MSRRAKLINKLANIQSDQTWTLADLILVLKQAGFSETGGRGSHRVFSHPSYSSVVTLAAHGKAVKGGYVKVVREALANLEQEQKDNS